MPMHAILRVEEKPFLALTALELQRQQSRAERECLCVRALAPVVGLSKSPRFQQGAGTGIERP